MRRGSLAVSSAAAFLLTATLPTFAQDTGCAGMKWAIDRERAAFAAGDLPTVEAGGPLPGSGQAVQVHLAAQDAAAFAVQPSRRPKNVPAYAGAFALADVAAPGAYDVTISRDAWIDVVQNGVILHQTRFTGSKTCPDIRKSVRFDLAKGTATIMISDAAEDRLKLEVLTPP